MVVDGHSLAFRAFYALPVESFSNKDGQNTNAIYGFLTMLAQVVESEHPNYLAVAFDVKGGTFRNELLEQYKGTRQAAPEELLSQLPLIQQALDALGITYIEKQGYEGDDLIATLATMGEQDHLDTLVLSGDRDAFQLVDDSITVLYPGHHFKDLKHMTPAAVEEKYHVTPQQYPDLAALRGETSDNIPGVPGVGDGYAAKWINQYGGLQGIIEHADEVPGKKGEALRENLEQVKLNRKVNALVRDVDLDVKIEDLDFGSVKPDAFDDLFKELEFGARTRTRLLKTFNNGGTNAQEEIVIPQRERIEIPDAELDVLQDAHALELWADQYIPQTTTAADEEHACTKTVENSWCLYTKGSAKPGKSSITRVALYAAGHAVVFDPQVTSMAHALQGILNAHGENLVVHGTKECEHMLDAAGLTLSRPYFDTKLAGYLLEPDFNGSSLEEYCERFLDVQLNAREQPVQGTLDLEDSSEEDPEKQCARAATMMANLALHFAPDIDTRGQYKLLRGIEIETANVLFHMEHVGARVDERRLQELYDRFSEESSQLQTLAWDAAGQNVNLQSPKQLGEVLFEKMGLTPTKKTKKGGYTTNAAALQTLFEESEEGTPENIFLGALLRHRETNKLQQIVKTLMDARNPKDGRIHTTFEQTVTTTGRLSSVDPNLQNIPNRNAAGREIRSAFVPGEEYVALLSADYSQVELRIMADLSGDEALIEAFKSGRDFHKYVASLVFNKPVDQITSDERSHVKAMSYGLAYGLSTYGLSQQLGVSTHEASALKKQYFATFGKVHDYLESLVAGARKRGYTETMFGRRRYFPGLRSTNRNVRDAAERGALNAPIQGTAADIMKIAMIRAQEVLREHQLKSRIVLQIHDELVVEVAAGEERLASQLVKDAMEHAVDIAVPLSVSTGMGTDWQEAAH